MNQRLQIKTKLQQSRSVGSMADETKTANAQSGKQAIGSWLKSKGTAIGVAVGVALTSLGDYLLGDTGLISFCIGIVKQVAAFF